MARAAATAASPICSRSSVETAGEGVSSMTFWCRRWIEQSRSPRWMTLPCRSAKIWISTWRASAIARSRISSSEPKALAASERLRASACGEVLGSSHEPHAAPAAARRGLDHQREADAAAFAISVSSDWSVPR